MVTFVKEYFAAPHREPTYHDLPELVLSGQELGEKLLSELRAAIRAQQEQPRISY